MGNIIDGKQLSLRLKGEMAEEVKALAEKYGRVPSLAVILVGEGTRPYFSCAFVGSYSCGRKPCKPVVCAWQD